MLDRAGQAGLAIFLVEQNYNLPIRSADTVSILANGSVVWRGSPGELSADLSAREAYPGV